MSRENPEPLVAGDARVRGVAEVHINIPAYLTKDPTLSLADRYVYGVLLKYVMIGERTGQGAFPGMETIARECGSSVASAMRSIKRLRERRWVARRRRGLGMTNVYELYGPAAEDETRGGGPDDRQKRQSANSAPAPFPELAAIPVLEVAAARVPEIAVAADKYDEREYDEREQYPPIVPPKGERAEHAFDSHLNARRIDASQPPLRRQRQRRRSELEHPYWQDERRRDLATRWLQAYPRKEDPEGGYRAWREVLGDNDGDQVLMARFGQTCRLRWEDWKEAPPHKIPAPATWLRRREWEHLEIIASVPRPQADPARPHHVSQAELNRATGKLVL